MNKINQILQKWPSGTVITSMWLKSQGIYKQLAEVYRRSGWIERIGRGAYKRKGDEVAWPGGLYPLQQYLDLGVHVGGKTALELQGFGHYLKWSEQERVVLWKKPEVRLPLWFKEYNWKAQINLRSATLFSGEVEAITTIKIDQIHIQLSSPERAILELLYDVPRYEGFDEANYLMEGLSTLRPTVLQPLLESCHSIKVKRLFMYLAEHYNHGWFKRLDRSNIDFGKGKREIIKGGILDKKYGIVVPPISREDQ